MDSCAASHALSCALCKGRDTLNEKTKRGKRGDRTKERSFCHAPCGLPLSNNLPQVLENIRTSALEFKFSAFPSWWILAFIFGFFVALNLLLLLN